MYNRYIPRGDGSYICRQEEDFDGRSPPVNTPTPPANREPEPVHPPLRGGKGLFGLGNISESLRSILPNNIDIGDLLLILILILLLIEGEDDEMIWILLIMLIL